MSNENKPNRAFKGLNTTILHCAVKRQLEEIIPYLDKNSNQRKLFGPGRQIGKWRASEVE
jgi:hypothetical protein